MLAIASATLLSADASSALSRSSAARDCLRPVVFELLERNVSFVADDGLSRRLDILLRDVELLHLGVEGRPGDHDLLIVIGPVDASEHGPRLHPRALVEGKL